MPRSSCSICDVPGIRVGCVHDDAGKTGCTVILPESGCTAGVDVRGSAPGTREVEALKPVRLIPYINAILLTGGSAFGLDAAGGVQQLLEERGQGVDVGPTTVPIVPAAVIFDLHEGDYRIRPDKQMGYEAAKNATSASPPEGRVGAGRGATVGKILGPDNAMKGGQASWCVSRGDVIVGALVVLNSFGNVVDHRSNTVLAGARDPQTGNVVDAEDLVWSRDSRMFGLRQNTSLAVIATNARLSKQEVTKVAQMAQDGFARSIRPAHTPFDGDLIFAVSAGDKEASVLAVGSTAAEVVSMSVSRAARIANHMK